ncbi:MAG: TIR domain-containing protein [Acidobacteriaceae bacterium]
MASMPVRVFTAFDYDHDEQLKHLLVGQSRNSDTPFELCDWSVKEPFPGDWQARVREKIRRVDQVIVLCGLYTDQATGVSAELRIAREEQKPYFLLAGYADQNCTRPTSALPSDKLYRWTWDNLKSLIAGNR